MPMDEENLLERYLLNEMEGAEKSAFEARLAAEPALAKALELERDVHSLIDYEGTAELKNRLQEIDRRIIPPTPKPKQTWHIWLSAAAVLAIIVSSLVLKFVYPDADTEALFAKHCHPIPNYIASRLPDNGFERVEKAMQLYDTQQWQAAATELENLKSEYPDKPILGLYGGISLLMAGQPEKAMKNFDFILTQPASQFHAHAQWYLAMSHLKMGDTETSRTILNEIVQQETSFKESAELLLKEL